MHTNIRAVILSLTSSFFRLSLVPLIVVLTFIPSVTCPPNSRSHIHWDSVRQGEVGVNGSVDIVCHAGHWITDISGDCSKYPCTPNDLVPNGTETCVSPEKDLCGFSPRLRCDPWCEPLLPPAHASVYPAERRRVGQNVTVHCDDRYFLTEFENLIASGNPQRGNGRNTSQNDCT